MGWILVALIFAIAWWLLDKSSRRPSPQPPKVIPQVQAPASTAYSAPLAAKPTAPTPSVPVFDRAELPPGILRQIDGLAERSMDQLRQQWLNTIGLIERADKARVAPFISFRQAIATEWGRRACEALSNPDRFAWPSTNAKGGSGILNGADWHLIGMLSYLGYRVGATQGEPEGVRRQILDLCFAGDLPPINGPAYLADWGDAGTAQRLRKLAHELASFARNAKRKRGTNLSIAVQDWEADLSYLYQRYYNGHFGFTWSQTSR